VSFGTQGQVVIPRRLHKESGIEDSTKATVQFPLPKLAIFVGEMQTTISSNRIPTGLSQESFP